MGSHCMFLPASLVILGKILNKEKCFFYEAKVFLGTWGTRVEKDRALFLPCKGHITMQLQPRKLLRSSRALLSLGLLVYLIMVAEW